MSQRDPGPIPKRWLRCPRKATGLVADKFLAFKTPLGPQFNDQVPEENRFTPSMLMAYTKSMKVSHIFYISCLLSTIATDRYSGKM